MVKLTLKKKLSQKEGEAESTSLGFKKISLLFNCGPFPGGGDCLIVKADGAIMAINSNDLIHDLEAYTIQSR